MKWVVECIQKVDFSYVVDLDPKDFLYCADEIELLDEVEDESEKCCQYCGRHLPQVWLDY